MKRQHGAFINARYSTDNQKQDSIAVQVTKCTKWCNENGLEILGVFADEAVSGMKDSRPEYDRMMQQLRMGLADTVVIYDQSRMFRKMTAWFEFRQELENLGVQVVSVTQPMVGKDLRDPANFMLEGSMALFNQIWALQTRQKVIEKMRFMARNGEWCGGQLPLGYDLQGKHLIINEQEAEIIRFIFGEYASGRSYASIIDELNERGWKTKRGAAFGKNSIHDLLKNEKYIGVLHYGKTVAAPDGRRNTHGEIPETAIRIENVIPAIVDRSVWDKVQGKLQTNKHDQSGRPPVNSPLSGKVYCGECESKMSIRTGKGYSYFDCNSKRQKRDCSVRGISREKLEQVVAQVVQELVGKPSNIQRISETIRQELFKDNGTSQAIASAKQELSAIDVKIGNLTSLLATGLQSEAVVQKLKELESEKKKANARIAELTAKAAEANAAYQSIEAIISQLSKTDLPATFWMSIVRKVEDYTDYIIVYVMIDPEGYKVPKEVINSLGDRSAPPNKLPNLLL